MKSSNTIKLAVGLEYLFATSLSKPTLRQYFSLKIAIDMLPLFTTIQISGIPSQGFGKLAIAVYLPTYVHLYESVCNKSHNWICSIILTPYNVPIEENYSIFAKILF